MTKLLWDQIGQRLYETGSDKGVLYVPTNGVFGPGSGHAWNGLTAVTESPSGAESTKTYADNIPYLNLISREEFMCTVEAYTYPDEYKACIGQIQSTPGVGIGQQSRKSFGLCYRTLIGNDTDATDYGYKLHLVYGCTAAPSEIAYATVNDSPEAIGLSWAISTIPVPITVTVDGKIPKPTSILTIDSTLVDADALAALEDILYGTVGVDARLPMPDEVITLFAGTINEATPSVPSFTSPTITIPSVTGIQYRRGDTNAVVSGTITISGASGSTLVIYAVPIPGYILTPGKDDDWMYTKA